MYRVVLDANVLISAFSGYKHGNSITVRIVQSLLESERAVIFISDHIAAEVGRALSRPYFRDRMTGSERMWAYEALRKPPFKRIEPVSIEGIASHVEDDAVIGTALAGEVDYLVTSDRQLLRLSRYRGFSIIDPPMFLAIIEATTNP